MSSIRPNHSLSLLLCTCLLSSCDFFQIKENEEVDKDAQQIARAYEDFLLLKDIEGMVTEEMSKEDSVDRVMRYIDSWGRKQLLIKQAAEEIEFDKAEIERKVLDYRYSLMGYEYQTFYINKHLDREVSEEEIVDYYKNNIDNFTLKQHIIKGVFISVPQEAPKTDDLKTLILSGKPKDKEALNAYCLSFATSYQLVDSWVNFEEVIRGTPLAGIPNKVQFLRNNKYVETDDENHRYFLNIEAYKISDQTSPLEFEREGIKEIILNKRKVALAKKLENEVYEKAISNNDFEIYKDH